LVSRCTSLCVCILFCPGCSVPSKGVLPIDAPPTNITGTLYQCVSDGTQYGCKLITVIRKQLVV
jgi:hypothetical protein